MWLWSQKPVVLPLASKCPGLGLESHRPQFPVGHSHRRQCRIWLQKLPTGNWGRWLSRL